MRLYLNGSLVARHALLHKNIFAGPHDVGSVEDGLEVINTELVLVHPCIARVLAHTHRGTEAKLTPKVCITTALLSWH